MKHSNSMIQEYKKCPLSYRFKYELGLVRQGDEKSEHHLLFGNAIHEGLKLIYLKDTLESAVKAFKVAYPVQLDKEDDTKTIETGEMALRAYASRWLEEDKKWRIITVEERTDFDYADDPFSVKLDLVMEHIDQGGIYGMDHKTVGGKKAYLSEDYWKRFEPNSQVTKYDSYIKSKYGDCSGFYINAIGFGCRERMYKGEPAGPWQRFGRMMFNRNDTQRRMEEEDSRYWLGRISHSSESKTWGMNTDSCTFCSYREICKSGWSWEEDQELITIQYDIKETEYTKEIKGVE